MKEHEVITSNKALNVYVISLVPYLSILLPFSIAVFYVHLFGVNVFFADEWYFLKILQKLDSGMLSIADLFAHHREHIYFFPWVVMLALGTLTEYKTVPLMYLVQLCLLVTSAILLLAFRRTLRHQPLVSILLFVPIPFLVFSFRQYENMLWGNQITFAFAQTFAVLALYILYVLENKDPKKLISLLSLGLVALASATIASFSSVQGLLVWPAGVLQLLITPINRSLKSLLLAGWGAVGLGEWIFYFTGKNAESESIYPISPYYALRHPAIAVDYFLTLLGSSLFWEETFAVSASLLLICLLVVGLLLLYRSGRLAENSFWVAILLFSLLSLIGITVGRSMFAENQAWWDQPLTSRYTIFSILTVVSVYAILVKLAWARKSHVVTALLGSLLGLVLLSIPTSYLLGVKAGEETKQYREEIAETVLNYESQPDSAFVRVVGQPQYVREYAPFLERHAYNVFAEQDTIGATESYDPSSGNN